MEKNDAMSQAISFLLEAAKQGKDFVVAQAPETIRQWLSMKAAENLCKIVGFGLGVVVFLYFANWLKKMRNSDFEMLLCFLVAFFFLIITANSAYDLYCILHFPKAYLLENFN